MQISSTQGNKPFAICFKYTDNTFFDYTSLLIQVLKGNLLALFTFGIF